MKVHKYLILVIGLLVTTSMVTADEIKEDRLTVQGKVKVFAKADRATVTFDVKSTGKSLKAAFDRAHQKIDSILTQLKEIGLDESNMSTSFFRGLENKGNKAFLSSKRDYKVSQTASVTTDQLDLLEEIVIILSNNKVERISDISFELTKFDDLRINAVKEAVAKAKAKAKVMTELLGVKIGRVIELIEQRSPGMRVYGRPVGDPLGGMFNSSMMEVRGRYHLDSTPGIFAKEFTFEAEVKIVFEIDNGSVESGEILPGKL